MKQSYSFSVTCSWPTNLLTFAPWQCREAGDASRSDGRFTFPSLRRAINSRGFAQPSKSYHLYLIGRVSLLRPWGVVAEALSTVAMKGNCSPTIYLSIYPVAFRISIIKSPFQITTLCPLHGSFSSIRKQHIT